MKLPDWLKVTKTTPGYRSVIVTLEVDTSGFDVGMLAASEAMRVDAYRRRIRHEKTLAECYVGRMLDELCYSFGFDPGKTWRGPRWDQHGAPRIEMSR